MFKKIKLIKTKYLLTSSILNRTFFSFLLLFSLTLTTQSFFSDSNLFNPNLQVLGEQTQIPLNPPFSKGEESETTPPFEKGRLGGILSSCRHCITGKNIKDSSISSNKIKNKSLLSEDIASNQINSRTIEDLSIQSEDLSNSLQSTINQAPLFSQWNKSSGIEIQESQITDLQSYILDGNTNWNNEYNFITASSTDTLTNKSGNISMWTNNTGYLTSYTETDPIFSSWNKSTGITITESQISNLQSYLTTISGLNISLLTNNTGYLTNLSSFTTDNLTQGTTNFYTQWTTNGTTISYTGGNVAIGTTNPLATFQVNDSTASFVITSAGQVGIGTTTPTESLHLSGNIRSNNYIGSGNRCVYVDLNGVLRVKSEDCGTSSGGDNLGNHTLTQNIIMGNNWISGDGDNEGFQINSTGILSGAQGNISMWTNDSNYITDGNTNWNNTYGFITSYTETDPIFTAWNKSTGISITESQISNLQSYLTSYTETDPIFSAHQANNITASHLTILGNTSNTNTGDETTSTIKTKLGTSSTSTDGYLTSTDWNIFNNKQPAGSYLTSYTETDPIYTAWNKSTGISITESQISNLQSYITDGNTNWNNSYGFITDLSTFTTDNLTQGTTNLYSQWATSGSNISFSGGSVGIGTTGPASLFNILGSTSSAGGALGSMAPQQIIMGGNANNRMELGMDNSGATAIAFIQSRNTVTGATHLSLNPAGGNVGIGTTVPEKNLQVNGQAYLLGSSAALYLSGSTMSWGNGAHYILGRANINDEHILGTTDGDLALAARVDENIIFGTTTNIGAMATARMAITHSGNIGIGTTNPNSKLFVASGELMVDYGLGGSSGGALRFASNANQAFIGSNHYYDGVQARGEYDRNGGASIISFDITAGATAGDILFQTAPSGTSGNTLTTTEVMRIKQAGNLGIGTTSPGAKLDVAGPILLSGSAMVNGPSLGKDNGGTTLTLTGGTAGIQFNTNTNSAALVNITNSGNVGIGTTSPGSKLAVFGGIRSNEWQPYGSASDDFYVDVEPGTRILRTRNWNVGSPNVLSTGIHTGTGYFEGNVGIGVTGPATKLEVYGNANIGHWDYALTKIGGSAYDWNGSSGTTPNVQFGNWYSDRSFVPWLTILRNGNVGIGTTGPNYKLDVNGTIRGYGITDSSDIRLKKNITSLPSVLNNLLNLRGVSYNWNDNLGLTTDTQIGLIAQELEQQFPDLVVTASDGYKSIQYGKLSVINLKAIQELEIKKADLTLLTTNQTAVDQSFVLLGTRITDLEELIPEITEKLEKKADLSQLDSVQTELSTNLTSLESRIFVLENAGLPEEFLSLQQALLENKIEFDAEGNLRVKKLEAEEMGLGVESSGKTFLPTGESEIEIFTSAVTLDSKIYITVADKLENRSLYIDQDSIQIGESFVVKLEGELSEKDLRFNWLIIN